MRIKESLLMVCEQAQQGLEEALTGLSRAASDEMPTIVNHKKVDAQWVYWYRDVEARKALASFLEKTPLNQATIFDIAPQDKHVALAVVLQQNSLWVGLRLGPGAVVDRRNLAARLGRSWERDQALAMLRQLPSEALVGFEGAQGPAVEATAEGLASLAEALTSSEAAWLVGRSLSPQEVVALGGGVVEHVRRWLSLLSPCYRFAAWTRDNDQIEATKRLQEEKAQKRRHATNYNPGDRVRVVSGLFSGKVGVVVDTDTKAQVRVRIGKMAVVLSGQDLVPAAG